MRCGEDVGTPFSAVTVPRPPPQHSTMYVAPEERDCGSTPCSFPRTHPGRGHPVSSWFFFLQGPCWGETSAVLTEPAPALSVSKAALLSRGGPESACSVASGVQGPGGA